MRLLLGTLEVVWFPGNTHVLGDFEFRNASGSFVSFPGFLGCFFFLLLPSLCGFRGDIEAFESAGGEGNVDGNVG